MKRRLKFVVVGVFASVLMAGTLLTATTATAEVCATGGLVTRCGGVPDYGGPDYLGPIYSGPGYLGFANSGPGYVIYPHLGRAR
jgi:hypothetical protein